MSNSLLVKKYSGEVEDFIKEKLHLSVYESLKHRQSALNDSLHLTDTIISRLLKDLRSPLIDQVNIIKTTHKVLSNFDKIAAVHYLAYNPIKE